MVRSLDSGSSQDTFSETPCDKDKRIVRTKIYKCVHCLREGSKTVKQLSYTFSSHVKQKHPKKVIPEKDGSNWKAQDGRDFRYEGKKNTIYKKKKIIEKSNE
jgi:hypothetical protein